jgi:hypothetical protein
VTALEQHHLAVRCARCGRTLASLEDLAAVARRAVEAHEHMRLAIPTALSAGIRTLAGQLACRAGACSYPGRRPEAGR